MIVSAGLACLIKALGAGRERSAWLAISAAVLAWGAAEIYWTAFIQNNPSAPYPSPADIGYLAFYPLAAAGVYLLIRERARELDWRLWMDGLIAALGTAALGTAFVFEYVADHTTGSRLEVTTTLAYPLGDILMLSLVVGVVALTRWRPGRTWSLLLLGLGALVVADIAFTLQIDRRRLPRRRLDRTDLPARGGLHRRRGLAAAGREDPARGPLRRLARADDPGPVHGRDPRALHASVLEDLEHAGSGADGGDDARGDRPAGDRRAARTSACSNRCEPIS